MLEFALIEGFTSDIEFGGDPVWVEALPARLYKTPMYGDVPVSIEKLQRMIKNFKENVRGQQIAVNYDHGQDKAKGAKAAGWISDLALKPSSSDPNQMSLYTALSFTDTAQAEVKAGEWKYLSMEWDDLWMDNAGGKHEDVVTGVALTNRPIAKGMETLPVNFSEELWNDLSADEQKQFATLTAGQRSALPDSAFLYIEKESGEPGEGKGEKETPQEDKHLPYKHADGSIDLPHLRAAISRLSQSATGTVGGDSWLTPTLRARLLAKARSILAAHSKKMSEEVLELIESDVLVLTDEHKELEHSEPGTGPAPVYLPDPTDPGTGQPVPRSPGNPADDPAIGGGWRRDPLPRDPNDPTAPKPSGTKREEGGSVLTSEELMIELKKKLGLTEDATPAEVIAVATTAFSENAELKNAVNAATEEKRFAEAYPTVWAEQVKLRAESATNRAKAFSESVGTITKTEGESQVKTNRGLSALALEQIAEVHKKFSEGTVTSEDFEKCISTITQGGIVEFGEKGSSQKGEEPITLDTSGTPGAVAANRRLFAEKVAEIQEADSLEFGPAMVEAAKRYPELAAEYRATAVA